jgi:hypothetical protein
MPEEEFIVSADEVLDIILDTLEIHWDVINGDRVDLDIVEGDLPFTGERIEAVITNPEVREIFNRRIAEAQAEGREFPLPSGRELAAARERALARRERDS